MKKQIQYVVLSFCLYMLILVFCIGVILVVQYHYHSDILSEIDSLTEEWEKYGSLDLSKKHLHGCIYFMEENSLTPTLIYEDNSYNLYQDFIIDYIQKLNSSDTLYKLRFKLNPLTCFVFASSVVYINNQPQGKLYAVHTISYLSSIINSFLMIYTVVYLLLLIHLFFIKRINKKVTDIYRKYVANISHELKTPIASIHAITETLNEGLVNDEETLHRYYCIIDRESHRLEQSVLDIIELSKIQEQRIDTKKKMTPISDIIVPISKRYKDFCEDVGIDFVIDSTVTQLPDLYTNGERIIQLFQILLDNAVKFTSENGRIEIYAKVNDKESIFCISDTGCGMNKETISHIFERFYRGHNTDEYAGSGLGLSIAREIVKALDEKIWAESILGVGTTFYFTVSHKQKYINIFSKHKKTL